MSVAPVLDFFSVFASYPFHLPASASCSICTDVHSLQRAFLLIDGEIGFRDIDQDAVEMFEQLKVPYGVRQIKDSSFLIVLLMLRGKGKVFDTMPRQITLH